MRARLGLPLAALLLAALAAVALARVTAPTAVAPPLSPPRPLLWQVSDKDNTVYLLGSFHALKPSDYPLAASVDAAFADAEAIAFEVSPEEMASPQLALEMIRAAKYPNGPRLQQDLDARTWHRLQLYAQRRGLDLSSLQSFEPWFISLSITMGEMGRIGYDPKQGLDQQLMARTAQAGKRSLGLELAASQIRVLDGMGPEEQRQSLAEALDDADAFRQHMDQLHDLWRRGDDAALAQLLTVEFREKYPALYRRVNVERNQAWMPKLRAMLEGETKDDTLVVVGAMHLLGPDGLVSQLRAQGFEVRRL